MDLSSFCLLAQLEPPGRQSYLAWMLSALGPFYGLAIPLAGLAVFVGACVVVATSRRPAVIASYLVFLPLPFLIGLFASLQGFIAAYSVIAQSPVTPKPAEIAVGVSTGLFATLFGLALTFPSYFVLAVGLFVRTLLSTGSQSGQQRRP